MAFDHLWNGFQSQLSPWTCRERHQVKLSCPWSFFLWKCSLTAAAQGKAGIVIIFLYHIKDKQDYQISKHNAKQKKTEWHSSCVSQTCLPPLFFYLYCNVTNQGTNTLCNMERSLLPTMFPNLQSSQSLQEVSPAEVRNQTNGNDDSSGAFIFFLLNFWRACQCIITFKQNSRSVWLLVTLKHIPKWYSETKTVWRQWTECKTDESKCSSY